MFKINIPQFNLLQYGKGLVNGTLRKIAIYNCRLLLHVPFDGPPQVLVDTPNNFPDSAN
jgi:hypothetical protein